MVKKERIHNVWALAKNDMPTIGIDLLVYFFTTYPTSMKYFRFKTSNVDELAKEASLKFHASRIMGEINFYVENLDDTDSVMHVLIANAQNHKRRKISKYEYDNLLNSMLHIFESRLGCEVFDKAAKETWTKLLNLLFNVITEENAE